MDELENMDDYEWGYQLYDGDVSIAEGTYVQINMGTWHTDVMKIYMNGEVVYTKPSGALYQEDVYHFTAGKNCKILGGNQNMFDWYTNPNVYITQDASVAVTGVTLNPNTAQTIDVGGSVAFTATVEPAGASDKTVKWSTTGGVTLYSDSNCTQAVGTAVTSTLTVYAKGTAAGSATVTATSNADSTKAASCNVTVNKGNPTAPTGLTATYGQKLSDVALPAGWTWTNSTQSVGNVVSPAATFKANFAGDDNYNAASNVDVAVTVSKANATDAMKAAAVSLKATKDQTATVSYTLPEGTTYGVVTNENTAYFTVDTSNGLTLTAAKDWTASEWGEGTKTFTVAMSGTNYNDYTLTVTVTPTYKQAQTITASDVTATYGDTGVKINASTTGDGALSYAVKSGDAVTVDASGNLTINKAGSAVILFINIPWKNAE